MKIVNAAPCHHASALTLVALALIAAEASAFAGGTGAQIGTGSATTAPPAIPLNNCARRIRDSMTGACLEASSVPMLGSLYPLSEDLFVDSSTGKVGIGTTSPFSRLSVQVAATAGSGRQGLLVENVADPTHFGLLAAVGVAAGVGKASLIQHGLNYSAIPGFAGWASLHGTGGVQLHAAEGSGVRFVTGPSNGTTRMHINSSGRIGVGIAPDNVDRLTVHGGFHAGVVGLSDESGGVRGECTNQAGAAVQAIGNFFATGNKSFVQPHPEDPSKELHFVCLEGHESGTYTRGSGRTTGGVAVIALPDVFSLATEPEGMTVQVTAFGPGRIWVEEKSSTTLIVRSDRNVDFDYLVNGVRRGYAGHQVVRENRHFVPDTRGVPFGPQYPEEARKLLVENGTLNPDYTPSERTAALEGWTLEDPSLEAPR